jgi:hypothetical protein
MLYSIYGRLHGNDSTIQYKLEYTDKYRAQPHRRILRFTTFMTCLYDVAGPVFATMAFSSSTRSVVESQRKNVLRQVKATIYGLYNSNVSLEYARGNRQTSGLYILYRVLQSCERRLKLMAYPMRYTFMQTVGTLHLGSCPICQAITT